MIKFANASKVIGEVYRLLEAQLELECKKSGAEKLQIEADADLQKAEANQIRIEAIVALHLKYIKNGVVLAL